MKEPTAHIVAAIVRCDQFCQRNRGVDFTVPAIDCWRDQDILRACRLVIFVLWLRRFFGLFR